MQGGYVRWSDSLRPSSNQWEIYYFAPKQQGVRKAIIRLLADGDGGNPRFMATISNGTEAPTTESFGVSSKKTKDSKKALQLLMSDVIKKLIELKRIPADVTIEYNNIFLNPKG